MPDTLHDINDTLEAELNLLIEQDGTMSHEASVQVDGDTTLLAFAFDDPELSQAETSSAYIPTTLAVRVARRILYLAGERLDLAALLSLSDDLHFTDPRAAIRLRTIAAGMVRESAIYKAIERDLAIERAANVVRLVRS